MPIDPTYISKNYEKQGGDEWFVGGKLIIGSGGQIIIESGGSEEVDSGAVFEENSIDLTALIAGLKANPVGGVAAGYKLARGVHQQAAAADTIITGLATVVAVVACWRDTPTVKQMFVTASIGDQAGTPAAGSILLKTFKPTAVNDVTPIAATDFTDNLSIDWIAVGA